MDSSAPSAVSRQTEFRLLKPMPSRQMPDDAGAILREQPWDTQIRRLFPPRDTPAANLPSVAGIQLGHFEIEERIARGGMGTVFRARDLRLDRVVALKVLSQDQLRDPAAVQRFQNEARAAAKLDHENIARVYYVGEDRGVHFIAFEYVRGTTVREAIAAKGHLTQDESVNYTLQAAEALRHTDLAGVVHRDIKPSNLIVTPSGRVKLVDLGLARQVNPTEDLDLTVTGTTLGTFDYISPEQARDPRNVDVRSDIYSLGCTLYQMLTGSPPYPTGGSVDKLLQHNAGRPPDPCELNSRISPRLALVVQRMMASNPDERYPTPQALIDELAELAAGLGLRATAPDGTIWRKSMYRGNSPWWEENRGWLLAFGIIFALALLGNSIQQFANSWRGSGDDSIVERREDLPGILDQSPVALASRTAPGAIPPGDNPPTPPDIGGMRLSGGSSTSPPAGHGQPGSASARPNTTTAQPIESTVAGNEARPPRTINSGGAPLDAAVLARATLANTAGAGFVRPPATAPLAAAATNSEQPSTAEASSSPSSPRTTPTAGSLAAIDPNVFVVLAADGSTMGRYQSLEAACHAAKSGAVIEIHHDGPLRTPLKPILIQGKRLTIRPATGLRPQLTFIPGDDFRDSRSVRMVDVVDGSVEIYDVDLVMQVTNNIFADEWVLLSLIRPQEVVLRRVTFSVSNSGWRPAVMIERRMTVGGPSSIMPKPDVMRDAEIQIRDCLFRGNATFYADRTLESASVRLSETAIGVQGDVLRVEGADRADMESPGRANLAVVRLELDHVTALTQSSILHLWTETARDVPDVRVDTRNSILDASSSEAPLILLAGHQDADLLLQRIHWFGNRNVLVTSGDQHCSVRGAWPLTGDEWNYTFGQWQAQYQLDWELASEAVSTDPILSWNADSAADMSSLQTSDFALRPMSAADVPNPAVASASDSSNRGFRPAYSPLPSNVVAVRAP